MNITTLPPARTADRITRDILLVESQLAANLNEEFRTLELELEREDLEDELLHLRAELRVK